MNYNIIETGSDGNATIVENIILIDCGVPFNRLRSYYKKISIVFISHRHSDHFNRSTVKKLAELRPTLRFMGGGYLKEELLECGVSEKNIDVVKSGILYDYGDLKVETVDLKHDVPNMGIKVMLKDKKLFYATDTKTLDGIEAKDFDVYLVEANYKSDEELHNRAISPEYEERVRNTHMSEEDTIEWLLDNMKETSIYEFMHQHKNRDTKLANRFVQIAPLLDEVSRITKKEYGLDDYSIYSALLDLLEVFNERTS